MTTYIPRRSRLAATAVLLLSLLPLSACAAKTETAPAHVERNGQIPSSGKVALRSGMSWMNETSPLFQTLRSSLSPLLQAKGLTVADAAPSALAPLPPDVSRWTDSPRQSAPEKSVTRGSSTVKLDAYKIPEHDKDLPASVMQVRPVDVPTSMYALSQVQGTPLMRRGGPIPGRLPEEMRTEDAQNASYTLVCRFAAVSPLRGVHHTSAAGGVSSPKRLTSGSDNPATFVTAAGPIRGVSTMGYGSPAPAARPRSSFGGTPGDYARGYEGMSPTPGDPWNREADFKARNYQERHSPPPAFATPPEGPAYMPPVEPSLPASPKPLLPGGQDLSVGSPHSSLPAARSGSAGAGSAPVSLSGGPIPASGYALELELYALAPVLEGGAPKLVWRSVVQQRADAPTLAAALPEMAALAVEGK